ncbi:MAG: hypothetical protein KGK35_05260 [Xanthomonadaceae bacterium]|nr:hypothetical protein [Xanthomonadaceae bacterium]
MAVHPIGAPASPQPLHEMPQASCKRDGFDCAKRWTRFAACAHASAIRIDDDRRISGEIRPAQAQRQVPGRSPERTVVR